jgi:dsRNA-specific ribonuclease
MKSTVAAKIKTEFAKLTPAEQRELLSDLTQLVNTTANPVTELAAFVQKKFGGNLTTEIWTEGAAHVPVVYCKFTIPDGTEYTASGKNQKIAKHLAAEQGLADLQARA